jgi:hypothetical protein
MNATRSLYAMTLLFGATGLALRLAPRPTPVAPAGVRGTPPPSPATSLPPARAPQDYSGIVAANPFSPSRAAPKARLVPEGLRKDSGQVALRRSRPEDVGPRLYGLTRSAEGAVALIDADPRIPGAEVYRPGDEIRGGRIVTITDSTVVLERPSGRLVLRLPPAARKRR